MIEGQTEIIDISSSQTEENGNTPASNERKPAATEKKPSAKPSKVGEETKSGAPAPKVCFKLYYV
jgi:hypothetical protein